MSRHQLALPGSGQYEAQRLEQFSLLEIAQVRLYTNLSTASAIPPLPGAHNHEHGGILRGLHDPGGVLKSVGAVQIEDDRLVWRAALPRLGNHQERLRWRCLVRIEPVGSQFVESDARQGFARRDL